MAIIEVRTRFTEDAKRKMASAGTSDRVGAMREIAGEIGLELIAGFSPTHTTRELRIYQVILQRFPYSRQF